MSADRSPDLIKPASGKKPGLALKGAELPTVVADAENAGSASVNDSHGNGYSDTSSTGEAKSSLASPVSWARDSLGSRASVSAMDAEAPHPSDATELPIPGADEGDAVDPCVVVSMPEDITAAREFFTAAKAAESAEQKKRAHKVSRVLSVMQYHRHPDTDEVIFTQEQLDEGVAALADRLYRWAYIWHDSDRLVEVDEGTTEMVCCGLKGLHVHIVLWFKDTDGPRPTVRMVSDALPVPSPRVRVPNEVDAIEKNAGRGAAEKAFYDHSANTCAMRRAGRRASSASITRIVITWSTSRNRATPANTSTAVVAW